MPIKSPFSLVLLAVLLSHATCLPWQGNSTEIDRGPPHFHPEVTYETYGEGLELPSDVARGAIEETAVSFAMYKLNVRKDQVVHRAGFSSDIIDHAYLNQVHSGIQFLNAVANVAMKGGKVVAFGSSFVTPVKIAASEPSVDKKAAIAAAEAALGCTYDSHPTSLQYLANPDGTASLVYVIQVKNDETGEYYQAHVNAHSAKLISTVSFAVAATYTAVPITRNSILDGQSVIPNPQDLTASPNGWHRDTRRSYDYTSGNNGYAYRMSDQHFAPESSGATYAYTYNTGLDPDAGYNVDAAIVNAFYLLGKVHDFTYRYGFTERAFNFQSTNFGRGGYENDGIIVSVNDRTKYNNAFFYAPPDGQPGTCRLHLFTDTQPYRPTAMENSVVVHEYGHGVSIRLVGGGSSTCLSTLVAKGLGEGWSDALADWTQQSSAITKNFVIGTYVIPPNIRRYGFRDYPYSTDPSVNPLTYSRVGQFSEEHYIGEVWANMLHNVYAKLVDAHGYDANAMTNPNGSAGNVVFLRLFMDAFSLLPCNPNFIHARNGILQADINRYRGTNNCLLWRAFASRGLGYYATQQYRDDYTIPNGC